MSAPKYRYGHGISKRRPRKTLFIVFGTFAVMALLAGLVVLDLRKSVAPAIEGESRSVSQVLSDNSQHAIINEPFYSFELPPDWKEIKRNDSSLYTSVTWQATLKGQDNRYLTIYIDKIPFDMPFNKLVTVRPQGAGIVYSDVSDNCANFTVGGTQERGPLNNSKPAVTRWNKVDFMCNLPQSTDNQVGTGSESMPNAITLTGPTQGTHKYFFLYIDRNFQPDYSIFYHVLDSFRAK